MSGYPSPARLFVAENLNLSNEEIIAAAEKAGIKGLDTKKVSNHRYNLSHPEMKAKAKAKKSVAKVKTNKVKTKAKPNGKTTEYSEKEAQARRLFFELGFDAVTRIYEEFLNLHVRMK